MMVLITYDVNTETAAGKKRLHLVAKQCQNYGQRVQYSVFECILDPALLKQLQNSLAKIIDEEKDSIRYYYLGDEWRNRVEHIGAKKRVGRVRTDYATDYGFGEKSVTSQMTDYARQKQVVRFFNKSIGFRLVIADTL